MVAKKKSGRGGALLLKKHGPDYFSKLRQKGVKKSQEAMKVYNSLQKKKTK